MCCYPYLFPHYLLTSLKKIQHLENPWGCPQYRIANRKNKFDRVLCFCFGNRNLLGLEVKLQNILRIWSNLHCSGTLTYAFFTCQTNVYIKTPFYLFLKVKVTFPKVRNHNCFFCFSSHSSTLPPTHTPTHPLKRVGLICSNLSSRKRKKNHATN